MASLSNCGSYITSMCVWRGVKIMNLDTILYIGLTAPVSPTIYCGEIMTNKLDYVVLGDPGVPCSWGTLSNLVETWGKRKHLL